MIRTRLLFATRGVDIGVACAGIGVFVSSPIATHGLTRWCASLIHQGLTELVSGHGAQTGVMRGVLVFGCHLQTIRRGQAMAGAVVVVVMLLIRLVVVVCESILVLILVLMALWCH